MSVFFDGLISFGHMLSEELPLELIFEIDLVFEFLSPLVDVYRVKLLVFGENLSTLLLIFGCWVSRDSLSLEAGVIELLVDIGMCCGIVNLVRALKGDF